MLAMWVPMVHCERDVRGMVTPALASADMVRPEQS
jgi:hypothetical protein